MIAIAAATLIYALSVGGDDSAPARVSQAKAERPSDQDIRGDEVSLMERQTMGTAEKATEPPRLPDWAKRLRESNDYFELAKEAAQAALAGDGRAAYHLAPLIAVCELIADDFIQVDGAEGIADRRLAYENHLALYFPDWPDGVREALLEQADKCARFANQDPFVDLPRREGGYSIIYWRELAVASGDPVARVEYALLELGQLWETHSKRRATALEKAKIAIREGIASGDREAIFKVGLALADSRIGADPEQGLAWSVVACRRGYDCAARYPATIFSQCAGSDACPEEADWDYYLRWNLGERAYARVFARAQALEDMLARGDWAQVEESLNFVPE